MVSHAILYFLTQEHAELDRIEFLLRGGFKKRIANRGRFDRPSGSYTRFQSTFQWTAAVHALALLLTRHAVLPIIKSWPDQKNLWTSAMLAGGKGTPALSLDYALDKMPLWLAEMFGSLETGEPIVRRLLGRINPSGKRPGPVAVYVKNNYLPSEAIRLFLDGIQLIESSAIYSSAHRLILDLESGWDKRFPGWKRNEDSALTLLQSSSLSHERVVLERGYETPANIDSHHNANIARDSTVKGNPYLAAVSAAWELAARKQPDQAVRVRCPVSEREVRMVSDVDRESFGRLAVPAETLIDWWRAYPEGVQVLFVGDRPLGAIGIWPLNPEQKDRFLAGEITEFDLKPPQMLESGQFRCWYIAAIFLIPTRRNTRAICALLHGAFRNWIDRASRKYPLDVYALGYSSHGAALLERFHFRCVDRGSKRNDKMPLYCIRFGSEDALITRWEGESYLPPRPGNSAAGI